MRWLIILLASCSASCSTPLSGQQVPKPQQASCMALRACVPVYDTVTQDFRVCCCNDSEARRMIWTRPAEMAGQAIQAVIRPQQQAINETTSRRGSPREPIAPKEMQVEIRKNWE